MRIRKEKKLICTWLGPCYLIFLGFLLACTLYKPDELELMATETPYPFVTSTTPNADTNIFGDSEESGYSTALYLRNCTLMKSFGVGLIRDGTGGEDGDKVLTAIFDELNEAYQSAYPDDDLELHARNYTSNKDIDDFVASKDYYGDALCFAIGWDKFDIDTHEFSVNLRWNYGSIPSTRLP